MWFRLHGREPRKLQGPLDYKPPTELEPTEEPHVFTLKQEGQSNETLRFELDAQGEVIRVCGSATNTVCG